MPIILDYHPLCFTINISIYFETFMKNKAHLVLYSATFLIFGQSINALGPFIPYLAESQGRIQTDYSFLWMTRTLGNIMGAIIYKILHEKKFLPSHHKLMVISSVLLFLSSILFTEWKQDTVKLGVASALLSLLGYFVNTTVNCCLMMAAPKEDLYIWLSITHGIFGIGALSSPLLINIFKLNSFSVFGIFSLLNAPLFLLFSSPEDIKKQEQDQLEAQQPVVEVKSDYLKLEILMSLGFFLIAGTESNVSGWISSYATMSGITDKQGAALFATLFWSFFTLFRFAFPLIKSKDSTKLQRCMDFCLLTLIICIVLTYFQEKSIATYICAAFLGIGFSQSFPLMLSMSREFNITFSQPQLVNMMTAMVLSQGTLSLATGVLMQRINYEMFFYSVLLMAFMLRLDIHLVISNMEEESLIAKPKQSESVAIESPVN